MPGSALSGRGNIPEGARAPSPYLASLLPLCSLGPRVGSPLKCVGLKVENKSWVLLLLLFSQTPFRAALPHFACCPQPTGNDVGLTPKAKPHRFLEKC